MKSVGGTQISLFLSSVVRKPSLLTLLHKRFVGTRTPFVPCSPVPTSRVVPDTSVKIKSPVSTTITSLLVLGVVSEGIRENGVLFLFRFIRSFYERVPFLTEISYSWREKDLKVPCLDFQGSGQSFPPLRWTRTNKETDSKY